VDQTHTETQQDLLGDISGFCFQALQGIDDDIIVQDVPGNRAELQKQPFLQFSETSLEFALQLQQTSATGVNVWPASLQHFAQALCLQTGGGYGKVDKGDARAEVWSECRGVVSGGQHHREGG
jgi:hypothetical protein